jgi:molybdate/tungstate transport system permease protein
MNWLKGNSVFIMASFALGSVMFLFLVVPVVNAITGSATDIPNVLSDHRTLDSIFTSFYCALLATVFAFAFGVPFAYLFSRHDFPGKEVVDSLLDIPVLIPHNAAGIALLVLLGPHSIVGSLLENVGVTFVDAIPGIVVAMAFVSGPFMIRSAQDAFVSINPEMEKVARSLGASRFRTFIYVTFPLALRGIITGGLLTWARAVSEFGAVVILSYYPKTAPVHLFDVFVSEGLRAALPINGLLILMSVLILIGFRVITSKSMSPMHG